MPAHLPMYLPRGPSLSIMSSFTGIMSSLHGRLDHLNSTVDLSLVTRSYNEKNDFWEPLIELVDGFLRYDSFY